VLRTGGGEAVGVVVVGVGVLLDLHHQLDQPLLGTALSLISVFSNSAINFKYLNVSAHVFVNNDGEREKIPKKKKNPSKFFEYLRVR